MTDRIDSFDRPNTTGGNIGTPSGGGSAWVQQSGTWDIAGNAAQCGAGSQATCVLESSVANVEVQATFATVSSQGGLVSRAADDNNYVLVHVDTTQVILYTKVAGSFNQIAIYSGTISNGDIIKLRSDSANLHTVYQNGVSRCSATDAAGSTNTKHGMRVNGDSGVRFDDFSITEIGGTATLDEDGEWIITTQSW